jgi:hypothetical protein
MRPVGPREEVICPKCRRYVGSLEKCPYCGAKVPMRLSIRLLKWGGLAIAVLGVMFLYVDLHATHIIVREPETIRISDITPTTNFGNVYITGKATFVKYYDDTKFLGMYLTDLDNENVDIYIRAYDAETKRLMDMETQRLAENSPDPKFPAVGDIVTVRGQIIVRGGAPEVEGGFAMMRIQYAEGVKVMRPEATRVTIEELVSNPKKFGRYQRVEIEGKIIDIGSIGWASIYTIYENGSEAEVSLMVPNLITMFGKTLDAKIGDRVRVKGAFELYYTQPQVWLSSVNELEVL